MINFKLDPEQFLALYNALGVHLDAEGAENIAGWGQVEEIRSSMANIILDSLRNVNIANNKPSFASWVEKEKKRVQELEEQLRSISVNLKQEESTIDDGLIPPRPRNEK